MNLPPFENQLFLLLFLAAVLHSLYLGVLLFFKSQQERGLGWLGAMMIPISFWLFNYVLYIGAFIRSAPHLLGVFAPLLYLMGPAYYFFVRRSSDSRYRFHWYHLLHLAPFLYVTWEWWPVYGWSAEAKLAVIERVYDLHRPTLIEMIRSNRLLFIVIGYVGFSYVRLKRQLHHTDPDQPRIRWLLQFTLVFAALLLLDFFIKMLFWSFAWNAALMELLLVLLIATAIHVVGYFVLGKDKVLPELVRPAAKYATSPLSAAQIAGYRQDIIRHLKTEQPWKDPDFTVGQLADALKIPRHHLSQVLNEGLQKSFYDLVAEFRIAEVKRRLQAGHAQQYSILGIAADCGFGSKSSFHRAFKKVTGMTPSAWLKAAREKNIAGK